MSRLLSEASELSVYHLDRRQGKTGSLLEGSWFRNQEVVLERVTRLCRVAYFCALSPTARPPVSPST